MGKPEEKDIPAAAVDTAGVLEASKRKKKKRNRKKKSKKGGGDDDARSTTSSDDAAAEEQAPRVGGVTAGAAAAALNPHDILRSRAMAEGFSARQVDRATEEMWDKNLAYDEFEAVLKYLKGEKDEPEKVAVSTSSSSITPNNEKVETDGGAEESKESDEPSDDDEPPQPVPVAAKSNHELKSPPPMTMEQKLETVAGFENMTDAIFALTEWISKAAKPRDLEDLCATKKTIALVTIFKRAITESEDQPHFDQSVLPSMTRLMESLLKKSGISSTAVTESQSAFERLLKQARSTYLLHQQPDDAGYFAERVSRFIVSRISLAIGESNDAAATNGNVVPVPASASTTGSSASGSSKTEDKGIAELLSRREINMTAAKRYGVLTRSACANLMSGGRPSAAVVANGGGSRETEIEKSDIMLALVGEDAKAAFELQKADLEELKSQAKQQESDTAQELRISIEELNEERQTVQQRIAELKQSIEKLETYDAELCVKVVDAQSELDEEIAQSSAEASSLNEKIKEGSDSLKYGNSVLGLVDLLKEYDDSLDKAISEPSKATSVPGVDPVEHAHRQMEVYLSRVRSYFQCEKETAEFLRNRIETSQKAVGELKIEIIECEGLGMNTTIGQMKEAVKTKEALIEKDSAMIPRFISEATSVFEALIGRLGEYKAAQSSSTRLGLLPSDILKDVRVFSSQLGVASVDRLDPFMTPMNGSGKAAAPLGMPSIGSAPTPVSTVMAATKPPVMPKFSWAAGAKASSDAGTKTSLLDIQKEELQSKK